MVLQYIVQNSEKYAFRKRDEAQKGRVATASALLTSSIADADVVTDWMYFFEIVSRGENEEQIPSWIRILQLMSCICGTLSWLAISSDGRLMDWIRQAVWWILWGCWWVIKIVFCPIDFVIGICCGVDIDDMLERAKTKLNRFFEEGFRISSGGLLMVGILTEDLPQIIVTFLIEDAIGSLGDEGGISRSAYLNLVIAVFDILHKMASAWDDRKIYIGTGTGARTFLGHTGRVASLAAMGLDRILSASDDRKAILWDIATGKIVKTFNILEWNWYGSITLLGTDRFVTTSSKIEGKIKIFDIQSGECLKTIDSGYNTKCTMVSSNGEYFLTSNWLSNIEEIKRWDAKTLEPVQTYPKKAESLVMIGDDQFVSANTRGKHGHPILWEVDSGRIIRNFNIKKSDSIVNAMCKHDEKSFLVASRNGWDTCIDMFSIGQSDPIKTMSIASYKVYCITSTGGDQFVTCEDKYGSKTADLWDISSGTHLHIFEGHSSPINDIIYLPEQRAIATASSDESIKLWPIPKFIADDSDVVGVKSDNPNIDDIENNKGP